MPDITRRFTFYGLLPPNSTKDHLAITLNEKSGLVKYCYCTSVFNLKILRYFACDCFIIKSEDMKPYFPNNAKETYIYISEDRIIDILLNVLVIKLAGGEDEERLPLDESLFNDFVESIKLSGNLSERFKKELLDFLEPGGPERTPAFNL